MTNQTHSGSSLVVDKVQQRGTKRYKARLPIIQRLSFSVGHFLNDAVLGAWVSYMLVFQTKVLGMSNRTAGYLWVISYTVDSVLSLGVGYICDNLKFPLLAKYYGKRKSFHLFGTVLVGGFFPFLMMPCFICGDDSSEWKMAIYYGTIMIVHNIGWAFTQVTHLALIPEIAKRPNEMVELHALSFFQCIVFLFYETTGFIAVKVNSSGHLPRREATRSGITFVSGIFVYAITWILLRTDGGDESISASQWKDFMEMAVIVVGTGCFFSLIFHLGTKEPPATMQNDKGPPDGFIGRERQRSRTATLPLPDKAVGVFCLYDEKDLNTTPVDDTSQGADSHLDVIKEEQLATIVLENKATEDKYTDSFDKKDVESCQTDLEKNKKYNEFSFSNPAFQTTDELVADGEKDVVVLNEHSGIETHVEHAEKPPKENEFSFSNPAFMSKDTEQDITGDIPQERNQLNVDLQQETLREERQSNRSDSSGFSEGYASAPETDSVYSIDGSFSENKHRTDQDEYMKDEAISQTRPRSHSSHRSRGSSFTKETDTSYSGVSVIIEVVNEHDMKSSKRNKTWIDWFKTPMFYKISFAYMCARLVQVLTSSYAPMYLTDTLGFEKESIAYFPLVILVSGVFSSLGAKKLDKMLGAKWTYCLASALVIGSSAWFYLQSASGRNASYCAAILMGCGGSVMYVTSLALAGELIGENKESGAFVFASMCILAKVACGGAIFFIQEFFPTDGATSEYVRYVFSVVPGAGSILGFFAVIAFLPATVKCRKVVHTVDSSAQTEDWSDDLYAYDNPAAMFDDSKENAETAVTTATDGKARLVS